MKEILGGNYIIYNDGRIYSNIKNKFIKCLITNSGYLQFQYKLSGKRKIASVHRLVAEAFIPNPLNKPVVNHIDGNKLNNNVSNLEWCTRSENDIHAFKTGLRKPSYARKGIPNVKLEKSINQLTMDGVFIKKWNSMAEAQRAGFSQGNIGMVINGIRNHHKGFKWEFA